MIRQLFCLIALVTACLVWPSDSWAIRVQGEGPTHSSALNNAFQQAVAMVIGTAVDAQTLVESGRLIKDEIISHSKGYVSRYKMIRKGQHDDGSGHFVEMDAEVNEGLIHDHVESLEILMKMTGHPKVLVFGMDDDMASVSVSSARFRNLTQSLEQLFQEKFRFRLLDRKMAEGKARRVYTPKPDKAEAVNMATAAEADIVLFVKINIHPKQASTKGGKLILEAVRVSDGFLLGQNSADLSITEQGNSHSERELLALHAAQERLFDTGVGLARLVVEDLQRRGERGTDYVILFHGFPRKNLEDFIPDKLSHLAGYVGQKMELMTEGEARIRYWSHLSLRDLDEWISKTLQEKGLKFHRRMGGQLLEYKWQHPLFD